MVNQRNIVRANRLQKYSRILADKYNIKLDVVCMPAYGYCHSVKNIVISSKLDKDEFINLILQKAITLHEIGHLCYTSNTVWKGINKDLSNIISDGRVEEAISRQYARARLYFVFANQKLLQVPEKSIYNKENLSRDELALLILDVVFREAKKTTGIPQLPLSTVERVKSLIGSSYDLLINDTRKAVDAKTEEQAATITKEIEERIRRLTEKQQNDELGFILSSSKISLENCGSSSKKMPGKTERDKREIDIIIKSLEKMAKEVSKGKKDNSIEVEKEEIPKLEEVLEEVIDTTKLDEEINELSRETSDTSIAGDTEAVDKCIDKPDKPTSENGLLDMITEQIKDEIIHELNTENDVIRSREMDPDFDNYNLDGDDKLKVMTKYGSVKLPIEVNNLEQFANRISHLFKSIAEKGDGWQHDQTRGKLEITRITRIISNDAHVFRKRNKIEKTDISAVILLDSSGSMKDRAKEAISAAYVITRALELGGYKSEVVQFGTRCYYYEKDLYGIKSFNQKVIYARDRFVPAALGLTPLFRAICGADKSIMMQNSKRKVVFVITDGSPTDDTKGDKCRQKISDMEKHGILVFGIMIKSNDHLKIFNKKHVTKCNEVNKLPQQMTEMIKEVLVTIR
jgi:uncharacterized protein YegL